jgi:hypothetical protein
MLPARSFAGRVATDLQAAGLETTRDFVPGDHDEPYWANFVVVGFVKLLPVITERVLTRLLHDRSPSKMFSLREKTYYTAGCYTTDCSACRPIHGCQ